MLKWNFTTPRPEFIDQLKSQMEPSFSKTLMEQMFHLDFKHHIKALDTLIKVSLLYCECAVNNQEFFLFINFCVGA